MRRRTSGVRRSNKVTILVREGLLVHIFRVLRVIIVISVMGGGSDGDVDVCPPPVSLSRGVGVPGGGCNL